MNASTRHTHTPGPWMASQAFFFGHDSWQITGTNGDTSPFLCRLTDDTPDYAANARLIASSPELLSALAGCADALREAGKDFARANPHAVRPNLYELHEKAARAAIAKATGGNAS